MTWNGANDPQEFIVDEEPCYRCAKDAQGENGVIYVRAKVDGRWQSAAVCRACWDAHHAPMVPIDLGPGND